MVAFDKVIQNGVASEVIDPNCLPEKPVRVTFQDIASASFAIKSGIKYTPCAKSKSMYNGVDVYFKKELLQFTGSFKERGARYALLKLSEEERTKGVIAASTGNHALGLSYHANKLGIQCTVVMPVTAPILKIQKCRSFNATVLVEGATVANAKYFALQMAKKQGLTYINGYDHPNVIAGQGTVGLEICEQISQPDAVIVPVGGGGLIAGLSTAVKILSPQTKIITVEPESCASFAKSMEHGRPTEMKIGSTLADGLAVPLIGFNSFETARPFVDKTIAVEEKWIALAILRLAEQEKVVVEGAGAVGLAAVLSGQLNEFKDKKVVLILGGGNIDATTFGRCLERGLASEGRLLRFSVTMDDWSAGKEQFYQTVASVGVTIKDIVHERDVNSVKVKVVCETRDWEHAQDLRSALLKKYHNTVFDDVSTISSTK